MRSIDMKKRLICLLLHLFILQILPCVAIEEINYESFDSLQEVIEFETSQISQADSNDPAMLADMYISRGESYLLGDQNDLALQDLQTGYEIAKASNSEDARPIFFRCLFGLAIANGNIGNLEEVYAIGESMKGILDSYKCACKGDNQIVNEKYLLRKQVFDATTRVDILGPDRISIGECINNAQGTASRARALISFVKRVEVQFTLNILIDDLLERSINCCRAGGIWKACLQPIVDKWNQWNEKWRVFGIPPDPAWD